jgi:hypothetical protein
VRLRYNMNDLIQASVGDAMSWLNIEDAEVVKSASGGNLNSSLRRSAVHGRLDIRDYPPGILGSA